jgi:multidrug efflux pump
VISYFFIDRPIFATVLSVAITLAGALAYKSLPVDQYPPVTPPTVNVSCSYPGASADVVADTVAAPIEQQVNGVEGMLYMSSNSGNDGSYGLTVTFKLGTNVKNALVLVQNRVALAVPQLPQEVQRQTINIRKKNPTILLTVAIHSSNPEHNYLFLSNYATLHLKEEIARLPGVGDISIFGQKDFCIRIWLDPEKLAARNITANEVIQALKSQSVEAAAGQIGQMPAPDAQSFQLPLDTLGRLSQPEQFAETIIKVRPSSTDQPSGAVVRLRDVARVELGAQQNDSYCKVNGQPAAGITVYQLPGSNALETRAVIMKTMERLSHNFPPGMTYDNEAVYDTTPFIEESILEVYWALGLAVVLVAVVVLVFLQSWRATLIPLAAVPVAIVGTLAPMLALGFSLNNLTLFGLVLAVGIVVDDAIVVVENVERWLETGLPPREATRKAMDEVTGPVVAVALVLCAVFVPCAFLGGITGQFFKQFAVTIAVSTVLSAFNSLTLSPALAALLLRPHGARKDPLTRLLNLVLGWFFWLFNRGFDKATAAYVAVVSLSLRLSLVVLLIYAGLLGLTDWAFRAAPTGFIPDQDKGRLLVNVQLPDAASLERTQVVIDRMEEIARHTRGVKTTMSYSGRSILGGGSGANFGSMFVILDDFDKRSGDPTLTGKAIQKALEDQFKGAVREGIVLVKPAAPIDGISAAGGFRFMLKDTKGLGPDQLQTVTNKFNSINRYKDPKFVEKAIAATPDKEPEIARRVEIASKIKKLSTMTATNPPQLYAEIDRTKLKALGVPLTELTSTLQVFLGSMYINNYNEFGRTWQVIAQGDMQFRDKPESIGKLKVRNNKGQMVPLATVVDIVLQNKPTGITRYNLFPAQSVNGDAPQGVSSGDFIKAVDELADLEQLSAKGVELEWTELALMEKDAGSILWTFGLAILFVFLVLSALYESWTLPLAVILVVPMCLLSAIVGIMLVPGKDMNLFSNIAFIVLVGLASKNAILIVEFAKQVHEEGQPLHKATTEACRLRLRPILMTSFAFILGVWPLVVATGAGAEMRQALGLAVFSGMVGVTMFGVFLTPVFFYVIQGFGDAAIFQGPVARRVGFGLFLLLNIALLGLPIVLLQLMGPAARKPHEHAPALPPPRRE